VQFCFVPLLTPAAQLRGELWVSDKAKDHMRSWAGWGADFFMPYPLSTAPGQRHRQADFDLLIDLLKSNAHRMPAFPYVLIGEMTVAPI
jgi:hypothetical protein